MRRRRAHWKRAAILVPALLAVVALALPPAGAQSTARQGPAQTPPPSRSYQPPPGALIAPGDAPDLTLVYSGNVIGYIEPCG